jgi:hypothetical protein
MALARAGGPGQKQKLGRAPEGGHSAPPGDQYRLPACCMHHAQERSVGDEANYHPGVAAQAGPVRLEPTAHDDQK